MQKLRQIKIKNKTAFFLVVIASLSITSHLAATRGLWSSLETQSAQIAREFIQRKGFIVPYLNGVPDYEKPAFFFWIIAIFSILFGKINELTARMPSLISVLIVLYSLRIISEKTEKKYIFPIASAIFITSPKIFWMSQVARIDMLFSAFCFASSSLIFVYTAEKKEKYLNLSAFFSAIAFLLKGPTGLIIPLFPAVIYAALKKDKVLMKKIFSIKNIIIFSITAFPWYVAVTIKTSGKFFTKFFLSDNIGRFIGPSTLSIAKEFSKRQPVWFYIPHFIAGFFPWSIIYITYFSKKIIKKDFDETELYFAIYSLFILFFFSIAGVKRSDYIIPMYGGCAVFLSNFILKEKKVWKILFTTSIIITAIYIIILLAHPLKEILRIGIIKNYFPKQDIKKAELFLKHIKNYYTFILFGLTISIFLSYKIISDKSSERALLYCTLINITLFIISAFAIINFIDNNRNIKKFCQNIQPIVKNKKLCFYGFWNDEFVFYLDKKIYPFSPDKNISFEELKASLKNNPNTMFLIRKKDLEKIKKNGIKPKFEYNKDAPKLYEIYLIGTKK